MRSTAAVRKSAAAGATDLACTQYTHSRAAEDPLSHGVLIPIRRDSSPYLKGSQVGATEFAAFRLYAEGLALFVCNDRVG